jgi:DNA-binding transcriptional MerR regulator
MTTRRGRSVSFALQWRQGGWRRGPVRAASRTGRRTGDGRAGEGAGAVAGGIPDDAAAYPIGRVAALTGLSPRQIRYYEQEGLLAAQRSPGRQRLYTHDQVALLQLIKRLRDEGYSLAAVREMLRAREASARARAPVPASAEAGGAAGRGAADPRPPRAAPAGQASGAFPGQQEVSLYPMVNRTRLLEILDRLERRDRRAAGGSGAGEGQDRR